MTPAAYEVRVNGQRLSREVLLAHGYPELVDQYPPHSKYAVFPDRERAQRLADTLNTSFREDHVTVEEIT